MSPDRTPDVTPSAAEVAELRAEAVEYVSGAARIARERQRQIDQEGWTPEHDAEHAAGELARAAECYLAGAMYAQRWPTARPGVVDVIERYGGDPETDADLAANDANPAAHAFGPKGPREWPWDISWWKPTPDAIGNLVKAGALIAAEIDRLQRRGNER